MDTFVHCPFCAGAEKLSAGALDTLAGLMAYYLAETQADSVAQRRPLDSTYAEIANIRNCILNKAERRAPPIDPLLE